MAGDRPGGRGGQLVLEHPRTARRSREPGPHRREADELHPSIFAWNLVDEVAGNGRDSAEVAYVRHCRGWLHAHDPTRMVAVDVWGDHPPAHPGALYRGVDAIAETDYSGWYDNPHNSPARGGRRDRARLSAMQRTFAGRCS